MSSFAKRIAIGVTAFTISTSAALAQQAAIATGNVDGTAPRTSMSAGSTRATTTAHAPLGVNGNTRANTTGEGPNAGSAAGSEIGGGAASGTN